MSGVCRDCRFFSDKIAKVQGGMVVAMCLHYASRHRGEYMGAWRRCSEFERGEPIDIDQEEVAHDGQA